MQLFFFTKSTHCPYLLSLLKSATIFLLFQKSPSSSRDSTPFSSKRMKTRGIKRGGRLEGWFSGEDGKIEKYL